MSLELKDFRGKLTVETDAVLDAEARVHGQDKSEIVREIMHAWALRKINAATVLHRIMKSEGLAAADGGGPDK